MGKPPEFPFVATSYRLTEHFHFWTKHAAIPSLLQPEQFVEIGEGLAELRGIKNGDLVVVRSKRSEIRVRALVTKRIGPLMIESKEIHTVGIPIHWGFRGLTKPGYLINALTPFVGDANVQTPVFKAFLVDIRKA
jgi:formate dehydrogenase major subunit